LTRQYRSDCGSSFSLWAILAAILFPVFAAAREKARATTCASNEKQIALGMLQYMQDYDEYPPMGLLGMGGCSTPYPGLGWAGQVYPYVKATTVFSCPDSPHYGQAFTVPGGPQRIIEGGLPCSMAVRNTLPLPVRCCWPTS